MAVFRVERNKGYTVMSNHHLRNRGLTLKAKGLLSQMLSLPEDWDYTLAGLSFINREKIDAIREAIKELERAGYIVRSRERDEKGRLRGADYVIFEQPQTPPVSDLTTAKRRAAPLSCGKTTAFLRNAKPPLARKSPPRCLRAAGRRSKSCIPRKRVKPMTEALY